jgi:hypothetical protein
MESFGIKNISDGYVTFEWHDGETHCLTEEEYEKFKKHEESLNDIISAD